MTESIEILNDGFSDHWMPFVGRETTELLRSNDRFLDVNGRMNEAGHRVLDETYRIMQACANPTKPNSIETGLVIGYVQSGKTLSFTTLTALARDNDFQVVILIAGTSVPLVNQSTNRLIKDLRLDSRYDRKWTLLKNPSRVEDGETIESALAQWRDETFPNEQCRTVLITVMKNGSHLRNLFDLLNGLSLSTVPVLIIDDEGDQASLNTLSRRAARDGIDVEDLTESQVSTIYRRITLLRGLFSRHTFLQYTATPQANLFINIMDRLSPNFIKLLTPGVEYTGGNEFFGEDLGVVREIPLRDSNVSEPPESFLYSLKLFYLGVVAGNILESFRSPDQRNRSMLVHPSRLQGDHTRYWTWVNAVKDSWRRLLAGSENDEKTELVNSFREAYWDLHNTVGESLPEFERLTDHNLIHAITYTPIIEVNARGGTTPRINWRDSYSWILVGGQAMDRGFTVEGLTVTYMPRDLGTGNVDTTLQRARFFGYKRSYFGYCRIFLGRNSIDAYRAIVEHEENVREQLQDFDINNRHLNNWEREVVLDGMLNLTRANVLYDELDRDSFGNEWFRIKAPHDTDEYIDANLTEIYSFLSTRINYFCEDAGHDQRTRDQRHLVGRFPLQDCLRNLLNRLRFTRESDSATYSSLRGILNRYITENPSEVCQIYLMSARGLADWTHRVRRLNQNDEIQQLFQGKQPTKDNSQFRVGDIYPGDSEIRDTGTLSIQIHLLDFRGTDYANVPTLAIWIPEHMSLEIIRQPQNGL